MLRLLVLRHAKSDWNRPGTPDFDRPLNARGKATAPLVGRHMKANGLVPRKAFCSSALRARETLAAVMVAIGADAEIRFSDALYEADPEELMGFVRANGGAASPLLVVGHNPTMRDFAYALLARDQRALAAEMSLTFPTAALAVLDTDIEDWGDLAWHGARLESFMRPRELA